MCAVYAMSDLHGCYDKYLQMLEVIAFSPSDRLYMIGDIVDRNPGAIDLMLDVMKRENVTLLLGNHEHMMIDYLEKRNTLRFTRSWLTLSGGAETMEGYQKLDRGTQQSVMTYLKQECPLFIQQLKVNERPFRLFHNSPPPDFLMKLWPQTEHQITFQALEALFKGSGSDYISNYRNFDLALLENDCEFRDLIHGEDTSPEDLADAVLKRILWERLDRNVMPEDDFIYIYGHTPVFQYDEAYDDGRPARIWHDATDRKFNLDCGLAPYMGIGREKGRLGCLRLDDLREFYID